MVRHYHKKSKKEEWDDGLMKLAIAEVAKGKSIAASALEFGLPRSTLQKKIKDFPTEPDNGTFKKCSGFQNTFTGDQEAALCQYILYLANRMLGMTSVHIRRLAYDFAVKCGIKHQFNEDKKLAGKDWLHNFMKKHGLSFRKPQQTSRARIYGFNEKSVSIFFLDYEELTDEYHFEPDQIWNVDESGFSVNHKSMMKVVASRGRKQVGGMTAAERGETVTAEICMSASGRSMPPMLIFPRVKPNPEYLVDAPTGAWAEFHKSGWIQEDIFTRWFIKFVEFTKPTKEKPVLLLLDGHATHVKNLNVIELANKNNVIVQCFPPPCTHKLQPLDVGFIKPLSTYYAQEVDQVQRKTPMTMKMVLSVFGKAFNKAAKPETAINAFAKTGIYPYNPSVFKKSDFATSQEQALNVNNSNIEKEKVAKNYDLLKSLDSSLKIHLITMLNKCSRMLM